MVKVVEREASELEVEHGWTRKWLVLAGGPTNTYIHTTMIRIFSPSTGEQNTPKMM